MSFFSNFFGLISSDDSYDLHLHFPLMLGDGKVDLSQEDRFLIIKDLKETIDTLITETTTPMVLAILDKKAQKAAKFNFFLYMDENKEFHVIDYSQGIPDLIKDLKVHRKSGSTTKEALQELKVKARVKGSSLKALKAQRKAIKEKIINLPYGVSAYPLEQELKKLNKAIKAKEDFKAKKAKKGKGKKAKGKKAKGKNKKSSNMEFMIGEGAKLQGLSGYALVKTAKSIAFLKGYNRVVLHEKKKKAWFFKVSGVRTVQVYTENFKAKRNSLEEEALKQGMLDWNRA